ncbi:hypothetical protein N7492_003921 [Penicillium capsulatum]|uniref:Zn(2)-C6 fungal-type domain-containing protein n=1 Tax=Penicillium capsulatum TaxID=69766 RepID=A0A9W9INY3_9EURO|nr:hypothetical protein N7492_003921 [Penicillium capsulatum]KAJ6121499.1 hypothetical protein N7512_003964 [Penicillium capsulatum]
MAVKERKRAFTKRSKTGCRTCRARRVKCDETPGACRNCTSAGWKCDGYDPVRLNPTVQKTEPKTPPSSLTLRRVPADLPGGNAEEKRGFAFFQNVTVPSITGFFDSQLWTDLVLPMSHAERAVNHAVIALSALHEDLELRGVPISREELNNRHHRFALAQYGRSLATLNERRHSQDPKLRDIVLTCCLLFVTFELHRGQFDSAFMHLKQGLAIIEEARLSDDAHHSSPHLNAIEKSLSSAMTRLETSSFYFGFSQFAILPESPRGDDGFKTVADARQSLDVLLARFTRFLKVCYEYPSKERLPEYHPELAERQHELNQEFRKYKNRLDWSEIHTVNAASKKEKRGLKLIRLHMVTFTLVCETALVGDDFSVFADYLDEFHQMLTLSQQISDSFLEGSRTGVRPGWLMDMGINPSLALICWKCHDWGLRERALEIMDAWPHREGIWDSRLLAVCVRQIMQLEYDFMAISGAMSPHMTIQGESLDVLADQNHAILKYQVAEPGLELHEQRRLVSFGEYA